MDTALEAYLLSHEHDTLRLLEELCRRPSISAQGRGLMEMAALVESLLQETDFRTQRLTVPAAPPVIYGELPGAGDYTLLLYNHYDVQPPEPLELWQSPPFEPTVREGKLYARGSSDNKGEIAARLAAIRALLAVDGRLPLTVRWVIEGEEEIGSPHFGEVAARYAPLLRADGALWEGEGFDPEGRPELCLGTKGLLYVQLEVQGTGIDTHSGAAPVLPSAAWRLVQALAALRAPDGTVRIPGFYDAVRPPAEEDLRALADLPVIDDLLRASYQVETFLDGLSGFHLRERLAFAPTCNIAGLLSGYTGAGSKTVLPARAMARIDFRLVPDQDPADILRKLQAFLAEQGYGDILVTCTEASEPVKTPLADPFVQRIAALATAYEGKRPAITPLAAGTLPLLGALRRYVGLPGLSAPGNPVYWGNAAHAPNEHIRLADLWRAVHFNCYLLRALAG
jgi:acetylornithine deacetylase/succinyl-diaminopimelate desuccinylase-like protein